MSTKLYQQGISYLLGLSHRFLYCSCVHELLQYEVQQTSLHQLTYLGYFHLEKRLFPCIYKTSINPIEILKKLENIKKLTRVFFERVKSLLIFML